jgi:hypothetical protein
LGGTADHPAFALRHQRPSARQRRKAGCACPPGKSILMAEPAGRAHAPAAAKTAEAPRRAEPGERHEALEARPEVAAEREQGEMLNGRPALATQRKSAERLAGRAPGPRPAQPPAPPNRTGLPDRLKSGVEALSGVSLDGVKVHYNSPKPAQLDAHAFAQGADIHLAPGHERHLPHEAWHVVQQAQGRVRPTMQLKGGVPVNDDHGLEREADAMGARAAAAGRDALQEQGRAGAAPPPAPLPLASTGTAQRYSIVGAGYVWGYGKGSGVNAPVFDFQQISASRIANAAASTIDYGVDAIQAIEASPLLRVSNDRSMAVPALAGAESKTFFATPAKIAESNDLLHNAGAPLRLAQGAGEIRLSNGINPFGPTLSGVTPNLANVVNDSSECGAFARNILGAPVENAETIAAGIVTQVPGLGITPGRDALVNAAVGGQDPATIGANRNANPEVGEAFGIYARNPVLGAGLMAAIWGGVLAVRNKISAAQPHLLWGEHWAGVVAKSGSDVVTLENYNRAIADADLAEARAEEDFKELVGTGGIGAYVANTAVYATLPAENWLARVARLGRNYMKSAVQIGDIAGHYANWVDRWYFQMYGAAGQSFHDAWKNSLPDSVTFKTRGTDAQLQALLVPKLDNLLPHDPYRAGAAVTLALHMANVNGAVGRAAIVAAFVAGEKAICLQRLTSANAFELGQPHNAPALAIAFNTALANVNAAVGDAVNVACVQGIGAMQAT